MSEEAAPEFSCGRAGTEVLFPMQTVSRFNQLSARTLHFRQQTEPHEMCCLGDFILSSGWPGRGSVLLGEHKKLEKEESQAGTVIRLLPQGIFCENKTSVPHYKGN